MLVTLIPLNVSAAEADSYVFFTEDVEEPTFEEWHVRWHKSDQNPNSSLDAWCRQMHNAHGGTHAAWCARQGYNSHYINDTGLQPMNVNITSMQPPIDYPNMVLRYDTNMDSIMRKELVGARYYDTITLTFWFYSDSGASDAKQPGTGQSVGFDFLNVIYYTGPTSNLVKHVLWTETEAQATAMTWNQVSVDVPNTATWVGFEFVSGTAPPQGGDAYNAFTDQGVRTTPQGASGMREGVFIDDISVVGTEPVGEVPLATHADPLPAYQTNATFPVAWSDNDPLYIPLQWIYLYYRQSGTLEWTKYTNEVKPGGAFISSPISFTAPGDGIYEFFTQGYDNNNTLENYRAVADTFTTVDTASPTTTINVTGNGHNGAYSGPITFALSSTDATSGVEQIQYSLDGSTWSNYTGVLGVSSTGSHEVDYYAVDKAGNVEVTKTTNIVISDGVAGITIVDDVKQFPDGNVTIDFTIASAAPITKLEYSLDNGAYVQMDPNATSVSLNGVEGGDHHLTIRATDSLNSVLVSETNFTVGKAESTSSVTDALGDPLVLGIIGIVAIAAIGGTFYFLRKKKA